MRKQIFIHNFRLPVETLEALIKDGYIPVQVPKGCDAQVLAPCVNLDSNDILRCLLGAVTANHYTKDAAFAFVQKLAKLSQSKAEGA